MNIWAKTNILSSSAILDDSVVTSLKHSSKEVLGLAVPDNSWCPTGIPYLYKTNPIPAYTSHHLHDFVVAIVSALVRELLVLLQGIIFSTAIWILLMNFKHFSDSKNHHSLPRGSSGNRNFPFSCHWGGFDENYAPGE